MQIMAYQKRYFKSKWNLFDLLLIVLSVIDLILTFTIFSGVDDECAADAAAGADVLLNPQLLKVAKSVRLLRLLRSLRLVKVSMTPIKYPSSFVY